MSNLIRRYEIMGMRGRLPTAFQQVEWIRSNGGGLINTTISIENENVEIDTRWAFLKNNPGYVCGVQNSQGDRLYLGVNNSGKFALSFGGLHSVLSSKAATKGTFYEIRATFENTKKELYVDNTLIASSSISGQHNSNLPLLIFGLNRNGSIEKYDSSCSYIKIKVGKKELSLIPCYLKTDWNDIPAGTIGLYDLRGSICPLTGTPFYTNAGTGTFTKGADVL